MIKVPRSLPDVPVPEGDTQHRILDAAHRVFMRSGTAGARMQEIAREAGVNPALLHYYFRSKARLSEAVFLRAAGQLFPAILAILNSDQSVSAKVEQVVEKELSKLSETPYLPAYILSELAHDPNRMRQLLTVVTGQHPSKAGQRLLSGLDSQLKAEARAGRLRPIAAEQFIVNLLSLCIFPFAARPMLTALFGLNDDRFSAFIAERRRSLPSFFLRALQP